MGKWTEYHFLRLSVNPPNEHASRISKALEDALAKLFGTSRARTYIDVLWISEKGDEVIVRVGEPYVPRYFWDEWMF
ncbi:hypothetical protein SISNIDRAFT_416818 [Sistotremastrum niveocremeum HHB9708]|uniref:Uncharacterized protein n=1 Tax=Sistotremastrum niveocremeum HHB9708 TaxID=1314777 RepID=A0A164QBD8_9AGAM|nr:hypothetical protein SISNIDRAFT_416818 [Sistotremastrum niveocremeum HHB9708]